MDQAPPIGGQEQPPKCHDRRMTGFRSHFLSAIIGGLTVVVASHVVEVVPNGLVGSAQAANAHPGHSERQVARPGCLRDSECPLAQRCRAWREIQPGGTFANAPTFGHCFPDIDADRDYDGIPDAVDTCPDTATANQLDTNRDGQGDVCDDDDDGDGVDDASDNCNARKNASQKDTDGDGRGDVCDDRDMLAWFWKTRPDLPGSH